MEDNEERAYDDRVFQDSHRHIMSSEIVEIDESRSYSSSVKDGGNNVYVAVGKDDLDVLKWSLNHAVLPGASVFLVHVFPSANYIPTPVGKMPRSQASQEQVRIFLRDENVKRRNVLQKYVRLCNDAKVTVETMLIESGQTSKAILELIPVLNITTLVMGTKKNPSSQSRKGRNKGEMVQKNAPEFCEVIIVFNGKKVVEEEQIEDKKSNGNGATRSSTVLNCLCFSS